MPRRARRTTLEKLKDELSEVLDSISGHEQAIMALREKEQSVRAAMEDEELKNLRDVLNENNLSVEEVKNLILSQTVISESA